MRTFLLGIDGSESSEKVVEYCEQIFEPGNENFLAVNIVPTIPDEVKDEVWDFETSQGDKGIFEMETEMMEYSEELVREVTKPLTDSGFEVIVETKLGHPGAELCNLAEANNVDGIVVGRSGKGVVSEMVLGSVSHYVIHHSKKPVVVVPVSTEEP